MKTAIHASGHVVGYEIIDTDHVCITAGETTESYSTPQRFVISRSEFCNDYITD